VPLTFNSNGNHPEGITESLDQETAADWREEALTSRSWRARLRRKERLQRIADAATEKWLGENAPSDFDPSAPESTLQDLPRPVKLGVKETTRGSALLDQPRELTFHAGVLRSLFHLLLWVRGILLFGLGVSWDWLRKRSTQESRARRLRETFERMGITFVKIGQQLSMRLDMLPYVYTRELEKLLDELPPFPSDQAISTIERVAGKPISEVFSVFDSNPIGSASVACVYQGILKTGERVAVKVRRPGVGPRLAADLRALRWLVYLLELAVLAPGFTSNFIHELGDMLTEELDFVREARFSELYRRRVRKVKEFSFVAVPKVFFDYSNDEVMVSEFVSGIWLSEILRAIETDDGAALKKLEEMNIDRTILARRIQLIARFNNFENIFFHADLHPANILVQPGNKLVLIDFGSCGSFNRKELNSWRRWFDAQSVDDVGGMVQAALGIIEPLPPIDRDEFGQRLETEFWNNLYAIKSKHSSWSERSPSSLWIGFLNLCREFQVPMRLNTLRMIRASMLTDTISVRLDHDQDPYREFRFYEKGAGKRAKKRLLKRLHRLARPRKFIGIENTLESGIKFIYRLQQTVDSLASIRIGAIIAKIDYFFSLMVKHIAWITGTAAMTTGYFWLFGHDPDTLSRYSIAGAFYAAVGNMWWRIIAFLPSILVLWRVSFRFKERRPWEDS
jgi:ubiquinone biosynthesis protein